MVLCAVVKFLHKLGHVHTERPKCLPNRWTWFCCCRRDTKHYISDYRHILGLGGPTVSNGKGKLKRKKNLHHFQFFIFNSNFLLSFCVNFLPKPRTLITCRFQVYVVNIKKSWGCGTTSCISTIEHLFDLSGCPLLWLPPLFAPPF